MAYGPNDSSVKLNFSVENGRENRSVVPPSPISVVKTAVPGTNVTTVVEDTIPNDEELLNSPARSHAGSQSAGEEGQDDQDEDADVEMEDVSGADGLEDVAQMFNQE